MYSFISEPNIPKNKVSHVIIADDNILKDALLKYNIKAFTVSDCNNLNLSIRNHADMLCNYVGNGEIFLEKSQRQLFDLLKEIGMKPYFIKEDLFEEYPSDVLLNCTVIGKNIICNKESISEDIKCYYNKKKYNFIYVKQGYTKCSICVVNNKAIITDDKGIAEKCRQKGEIDALLIEKGDIYLKGMNYGFIGGCSGLIDKNKLAFYGNILNHRNYYDIKNFLNKHGVEMISLVDGPLIDVGGIIPICENI